VPVDLSGHDGLELAEQAGGQDVVVTSGQGELLA
jgi:hypothetical protein